MLCAGLIGVAPSFASETRALVPNSVHPQVRGRQALGQASSSLTLDGMVLCLKRSAETQAALDAFLADVHDPASPQYHQWLTPEAFGSRFGASQASLDAGVAWLVAQGFSIDGISPSHMSIQFSGSKAAVENAFQTQMMLFEVDGTLRHANATPVSIPAGLAAHVEGPLSLTNIPHLRRQTRRSAPQSSPMLNWSDGSHSLAPGDFSTLYNLKSLYASGVTGSGVTIAIAGRSNITLSDITYFRNFFSLPTNTPTVVLAGTNPGIASDEGEALLDATWSGAVAKGANVKLVIADSTTALDGVDIACQYIVDQNLAPVMSLSYGSCEADMGSTWNAWYGNLWAQAAAEGITVCVSSGDSGPSECDSGSDTTGSGLAVNGLASTPYNVCVGGTQFNEGSGTYWSTSNADYSSVLSYIPEGPWNESASVSGGSGLWSGGGGTSTTWARPSWQSVTGALSSSSYRDCPDVSLTAASHDGYAVYSGTYWYNYSGTSASAPSFAGLMALIVQSYGRQGNPNPTLYALGRAQYNSGSVSVFHDVTSGNTTVPGVTGFTAVTGYDRATGLGSVDAAALWSNWAAYATTAGPSITTQPQSQSVASGNSATFSVVASGTGTLKYQWQVSANSGTTWSNLGTGSGYATASYTTPATASGDTGKLYRVEVRDNAGALYSSSATLTVGASGVTLDAASSTPATATGGSLTLTATVGGTSTTGVTWTAASGALSATTGASVTWTAPATAGTYAVKATSQADASVGSTLNLAVKSMDLTGDGTASDVLDFAPLAWAYGATSANANWIAGADLNGDGVVDSSDLALFNALAGF